MLETVLALIAFPLLAMSSGACTNSAIVSAVANPAGNNGDVNAYDVGITVKNTGGSAQPASLLQSVEIFQNGDKVDQKGVPPLRAGASATVHYRLQRSAESREGTTPLRFQLIQHDPHGHVLDCTNGNARYRLSV